MHRSPCPASPQPLHLRKVCGFARFRSYGGGLEPRYPPSFVVYLIAHWALKPSNSPALSFIVIVNVGFTVQLTKTETATEIQQKL